MSYLDRIAECNRHDLQRYVPFRVGGERVGWVRRDRRTALRAFDALVVTEREVRLDDALATPEQRTAAMADVAAALQRQGAIGTGLDECYPVMTHFGGPIRLHLQRLAVPYFGVHAFGVHLNGYVGDGDARTMWVARRARDKPTYPGMLDNLVAGGLPAGISPWDNLLKECAEEAAIPIELARRARAVGAITYCHENPTGLKPDCMFCYDLELPADFEPAPADGEAEGFHRWPVDRVAALVRDSDEFKFNCNLVILDFLVRHGYVTAEDPDYLPILHGLRSWGSP